MHLLKKFLFFTFIFVFDGVAGMAQIGREESDLKAAFIYNFTKYIDWDSSIPDEFTIGIIGSSSIYESLVEIANSKKVNDKKIVVRHFSKPDEITPCNILFISRNASFSLPAILAQTNRGALSISEEAGYAEQGTAFNFVVVNDKLKFEANVKSINSAGLKASSQLLKLAIIVD